MKVFTVFGICILAIAGFVFGMFSSNQNTTQAEPNNNVKTENLQNIEKNIEFTNTAKPEDGTDYKFKSIALDKNNSKSSINLDNLSYSGNLFIGTKIVGKEQENKVFALFVKWKKIPADVMFEKVGVKEIDEIESIEDCPVSFDGKNIILSSDSINNAKEKDLIIFGELSEGKEIETKSSTSKSSFSGNSAFFNGEKRDFSPMAPLHLIHEIKFRKLDETLKKAGVKHTIVNKGVTK